MLDVFVMLEGYCNLIIERLHLIEEEKLVSSTIFFFLVRVSVYIPVFRLKFLIITLSFCFVAECALMS